MRTLFEIPPTNETKIYAYLDGDYQEMEKNDTILSCSLQKNQVTNTT